MKKCYSTLMAAAVCIAGAANAASVNSLDAKTLPIGTVASQFSKSISLADAVKEAASKPVLKKAPSFAPPEGEWTLLGNAIWHEDILTLFSDIEKGQSWEVPVYQSVTNPNYYKVAPYDEGSPIAEFMQMADPQAIFYINATDPDKVYVDGDVNLYNAFVISQLTPENGWDDYAVYGTFSDKIFEFPAESFGIYVQQEWALTAKDGDFKISLPGAVVKDYSISVSAPLCAENNAITARLTTGADVSDIKYVTLPGYYVSSPENNALVAEQGETVPQGASTLSLTADEPGMYSLLITTVSESKAKKGASLVFFVLDDDADNWETLPGKAEYTDGYFSGLFQNFPAETMNVTVQEHKTKKGYYRIEDPYTEHSIMNPLVHESHHHYIFIDATNPSRVMIEPSPLGVDDEDYGEIYAWSYAHLYTINEAADEAAQQGLFGKKSNNVITMPDESLLISMNKFNDGAIYYTGEGFKVKLPDLSGVSEIEADSEAPVRYFNLQGVEVSNPANGLFIRVRGNNSEKVIL